MLAWAVPALAQAAPAASPPPESPPEAPPAATPAPAAPPPSEAPPATPEQRYAKGKSLFEYGDCAGTIDQLAPLVVPGTLGDERQQLDVHRMLGICLALANKPIEAARELSSLLAIDPEYTLDPFLTPPVAVEIFEKQKASMRVQLEEIRRAREAEKKDNLDGGVLVERVTTVRETPLAAAFLPFGLAQAANEDLVMAIVLGSVQAATLGAAVVGFWGDQVARGDIISIYKRDPASPPPPISIGEAEANHHVFWAVQLGGAMAFALAYGFGVADALWNYEDRAIVERKQTRRPLTAAEIKAVRKIAPAPAEPAAPPGDPVPVEP